MITMAEIILPGQSLQQDTETGQQDCIETRSLACTHPLDRADEFGVESQILALRGEAALTRTRPIHGQFERFGQIGEAAEPVAFIGAEFRRQRMAGFLLGEIGERIRRRQRVTAGFASNRVQGRQITHDHAERPAVTDDVVRAQDQQMILGGQAQQLATKHRTFGEIEFRFNDTAQGLGNRRLTSRFVEARQVALDKWQLGLGNDAELLAIRTQRSAQGLVSVENCLQRTAQGIRIERPVQLQRH